MIRCFTLFDITQNGDSQHIHNQTRNWHTLLQTLSLRSPIIVDNYPKKIFRNVNGLEFGENFNGFHEMWMFDFQYDKKINLELIVKDTNYIPMITGLEETVILDKKCLISIGIDKNISFLYM